MLPLADNIDGRILKIWQKNGTLEISSYVLDKIMKSMTIFLFLENIPYEKIMKAHQDLLIA